MVNFYPPRLKSTSSTSSKWSSNVLAVSKDSQPGGLRKMCLFTEDFLKPKVQKTAGKGNETHFCAFPLLLEHDESVFS